MNTKGFKDQLFRLSALGNVPVIVDMKRISPKDGVLLPEGEEAAYAKKLQQAGASLFSVVTEGTHFGGSLQMMERIATATGCPILRKDFISTAEHLKETVAYGGSAILLISSHMDKKTLYYLYEKALDMNLDPLVEVHTPEELDNALSLHPSILGVNNKNIGQLEKDDGTVSTSETLIPLIPEEIITISESSISSREDVQRAIKSGAGAVLVGTAIWRAEDPADFYRSLCCKSKNIEL